MTDEPQAPEEEPAPNQEPEPPEVVLARIRSWPLVGQGPSPWEGVDIATPEGEAAHTAVGLGLAHAFLVLCEEQPDLLDVPSLEDDPQGVARAYNDRLYDAFTARFPDHRDWTQGATGYQFGWAHGIVRYALGREPVGNPAILSWG